MNKHETIDFLSRVILYLLEAGERDYDALDVVAWAGLQLLMESVAHDGASSLENCRMWEHPA